MLSILRKKKTMKRILWGLAIIIIPAFVFWGAGSLVKDKTVVMDIGEIDGKKVSVEEFAESIKNVRIGLFLHYFNQPEALNKLQQDKKLINRLAWENIIVDRAAKKEGLDVSDKEVVSFVTSHPLFIRGSAFDQELYNYLLKNSFGMTPRDFEETVRKFLINLRLKEQIIQDVSLRDEDIRSAYRNEFEKASVYYVLVGKDAFKEKAQVLPEEISLFYEENKTTFVRPEKVIVKHVAFPHKEENSKEKAVDEIREVYEKIKARPEDMEKAASGLGLNVKETLPFSRNETPMELGNIKELGVAAFSLRPGKDVIPLIDENEIGVSYILLVKERFPQGIKPIEEVSGYIETVLLESKALGMAKDRALMIYNKSKEKQADIIDLSKTYDLKLEKTPLITRFDYLEGVGEARGIVGEAFKTTKGELSGPILARKGYVIIQPIELKEIDEEKFEKEKSAYSNNLLAAKKLKAIEDWFSMSGENSKLNVDLGRL